ncbi:MAG TPA: CbiX/SirB N-terminal domain-containing protein [Kiritimatiellia bacterium]|nr:CbiX/SirB N-terminal domain-containing protein [Kiritimatiellia bacterium]
MKEHPLQIDAASPAVGVLLVSHGSRSPTWRQMLLAVEDDVRETLLAMPGVAGVRSAFMENAEPSIADQLKAFDRDGVNRVVIVPLLLTISNHTFDDIPTICGLKSDPACMAALEQEQIERYVPRAQVVLTPLLDYPRMVRINIARRVRLLQQGAAPADPRRDGLVLVGYGSAEFDNPWESFFSELSDFAVRELGLATAAHAWCGHIVHYAMEPTVSAIQRVLANADRALVLPLLVAFDEMFQLRIIGGAVEQVAVPGHVLYRADAILPEPEVARWVIEAVRGQMETPIEETVNCMEECHDQHE